MFTHVYYTWLLGAHLFPNATIPLVQIWQRCGYFQSRCHMHWEYVICASILGYEAMIMLAATVSVQYH